MTKAVFYPVNLVLQDRSCLVVGGGIVAERKARTLLEFGAKVTVVAPEVSPGLARLATSKKVRWLKERFKVRHLKSSFVVIAATNARFVNKSVSDAARRKNILVNAVDMPELCTFYVPSIVRRGQLVISVSTSALSPVTGQHVCRRIARAVPEYYSEIMSIMARVRRKSLSRYKDMNARKAAQEKVLRQVIRLVKLQVKPSAAKIRAIVNQV